jgi:hypothetical protein
MRPLLLLASLLLVVGCQPHRALSRSSAVSLAENLQLREGLEWGSPVEVLAPSACDADGRCWWQLRYAAPRPAPGQGATARVILVDAASGWARLPPPGWAVRLPPCAPPTTTPAAAQLVDGRSILVVAEPVAVDTARLGELEREAARLNDLAVRGGLWPAFKVHTDRAGRTSLIYGWQGDRGIAPDEAVRDWVQIRAGTKSARWVDLGGLEPHAAR